MQHKNFILGMIVAFVLVALFKFGSDATIIPLSPDVIYVDRGICESNHLPECADSEPKIQIKIGNLVLGDNPNFVIINNAKLRTNYNRTAFVLTIPNVDGQKDFTLHINKGIAYCYEKENKQCYSY